MSRTSPVVALVGLALGALACGGASRPDAVRVEPPTADSAATDRAGPVVEIDSLPAPEPTRPWLPAGVTWEPPDPQEGEAVGIWIFPARSGRPPADVQGELGGRPVRFAPAGHGWFGVGAVPIGSSGQQTLRLRFRLAPDSVVAQRTRLTVGDHTFPATELSVDPRYTRPSPEALIRIEEERKLMRAALAKVTDEWLPRGDFAWPRESPITSPFGQRRIFNGELRSRHTGVDLDGETGDPVLAAARGRVALTGDFYYTGNAVFLNHGLGVYTGYFHLSRVHVREGDLVEKGQLLGEVGATGRVTGPHLHWSLHVHGESLDARSLFRLRLPESAEASLEVGAP